MADQDEMTTPEVSGEEQKSFWQRNGATVITIVILGLIIGGAIAVNERRAANDFETDTIVLDDREQDDVTSPVAGGDQDQTGDVADSQTGEIASGTRTPASPTTATFGEVRAHDGGFTVSAAPGEGRTHLARRAITEQLRQIDTNLSPEQRVYAEDYLQKKYADKDTLHPGSTLSFSVDQINESISASQNLDSAQLQNLTQYSVLVNWPPI